MTVRNFETHTPQLAQRVFVDPTALVLGRVELDDDVSVWPMTTVRGDIHTITIGARTNIQDNSVLHVTHVHPEYSPKGAPLLIGADVTVGHGVILHGCTIGNCCLIGMGSIVLDGAIIHDHVMVGANSLVVSGKELESGFLYLGNPARRVRALTVQEQDFLRYSAEHYVELKDRHQHALTLTDNLEISR